MTFAAERMKRLPKQFFAALTQRAAIAQAAGRDVINLGQGNPDQPTPPHIVEALRRSALDSATHRYSPFRGLSALREAICEFYHREHGVVLEPERDVAILFGSKAGLVEISQCILDPGDVALMPDPGYPDYWSGVALSGATPHLMTLREADGFLPDYSDIPDAVSKRAKLLFLNYPNNPTAATANADFFARTVHYARQHDVLVAHDFAYGEIAFEDKPRSFLQTPGAKEVGVEFYTLSKTYNMAGWRVGFALGNPEAVGLLNEWQDHHYVSLFGAVQVAAIEALRGDQACVQELVDVYRRRQEAFLAPMRNFGLKTLPAPGSFFVWLPLPAGWSSEPFAEGLLLRESVVVAPGIGFGAGGEGYVRVAMLESEARLAEAAGRICRFVAENSPRTALDA